MAEEWRIDLVCAHGMLPYVSLVTLIGVKRTSVQNVSVDPQYPSFLGRVIHCGREQSEVPVAFAD